MTSANIGSVITETLEHYQLQMKFQVAGAHNTETFIYSSILMHENFLNGEKALLARVHRELTRSDLKDMLTSSNRNRFEA